MKTIRYLSLGAGVQSTALLVMSARGLRGCPKADVAIFADTGCEPRWVYDHLEYLKKWSSIPIEVVSAGKALDATYLSARHYVLVPFYSFNLAGEPIILRRQCTAEYKIRPIERRVKALLGFQKGERVKDRGEAEAMIGISLDEVRRMRTSRTPWIVNTYPLIDARMTRGHCLDLIRAERVPIPRKSACRICPFRSDESWREMRDHSPEDFEKACQFDDDLRQVRQSYFNENFHSLIYLHSSRRPLREIDFDDHQATFDFFEQECFGMCGV